MTKMLGFSYLRRSFYCQCEDLLDSGVQLSDYYNKYRSLVSIKG